MVDGGSVGGVVEAKLGGRVGRVDVVVSVGPPAGAGGQDAHGAGRQCQGQRPDTGSAEPGSQLPQRGDALLERRVGVEQAVEA